MKAKYKSPLQSTDSPPDAWRRQAEEKHKAILEMAIDGFWVADSNGRLLEVNDSYCEMIGYTREELLTMSIPDIEAAETPEQTTQHMKELMEQGHDHFQTRHKRKDGKIIDVEVSANYIDVEGGQLFVFVRDVTKRKRAEQALRESESKYRTLVESIPQRIFLKDKNSVYLSCNRNYAEDLGIEPQEIAGRTDYDFYPGDLAEKYRADDQRIIESGNTQGIEERYVHHGQERIVETFKTPVRDENGQLVGILGIFHDITERKHTRDRLLEYKTAVDQSADGIALANLDGHIRFVNEAWAGMHGLSVQESTGQHLSIFHTQEQMESDVIPFNRRLLQTNSNAGEVWHVTKNGQPFLAWMTTTVLKRADQRPFGLLAIMRDITEQKEMERQRRDHEIAEARAEELAKSRGRLLSAQESLHKEIASQLHGTVQSRLILLGQKLAELEARPASERTTEELADIRQKLEELQNDHIRPISHRLFPSILRMGLAAGLESLVDEYGTRLHIDLQVSKQLRDKEQVNRRLIPDNVKLSLYRIAEEALANIVKHTPPAENVVVKLSPSDSRALRLAVSDDGAGFDEASPSTGIGLAIMSDYAAAAGGSCAIKSVPGKGTRVTAEVPLTALQAQ
ncbi:MAG: PAS domain S-box protein [Dehalococcoidia bacterium]